MIPPVAPGQSEEKHNMIGWKNTFNMRQVTLLNLAATHLGVKNGTRFAIPNHRRAYSCTSTAKSLDLLRKNLQSAINKDIDNVVRKYLEKFFQPAVTNIKANLGPESVTEDHIKDVCKQMLEEAKIMYNVDQENSRDSSPYEYISQSEAESDNSFSDTRLERMSPSNFIASSQPLKRKELEESELTSNPAPSLKRHRNKMSVGNDYIGCKLSMKRDGPKWDPERITSKTLFIMGAKANKVLGYGQTRGRLYVRHPNLVRYSGDQEDKEWLASQNLMPPSGGKAYLMLMEDIKELTESEEYRHSPNLQLHEMAGFEVPMFLMNKVKNFIEYVRNERQLLAILDVEDNTSSTETTQTPSPNVTLLDSSISTSPDENLDNTLYTIKSSQIRQQIDYPNMSSDMSSLSSSVISSILSGNYSGSLKSFGSDNAQSF